MQWKGLQSPHCTNNFCKNYVIKLDQIQHIGLKIDYLCFRGIQAFAIHPQAAMALLHQESQEMKKSQYVNTSRHCHVCLYGHLSYRNIGAFMREFYHVLWNTAKWKDENPWKSAKIITYLGYTYCLKRWSWLKLWSYSRILDSNQ